MYNRASKAQGKLSSLALMHIHYGTEVNLGEVVDFFCPEASNPQGGLSLAHYWKINGKIHLI